MERDKLEELVTDLKFIREMVYNITKGSNPYARREATNVACGVIHDITEKYKKLLREAK